MYVSPCDHTSMDATKMKFNPYIRTLFFHLVHAQLLKVHNILEFCCQADMAARLVPGQSDIKLTRTDVKLIASNFLNVTQNPRISENVSCS